MFEKHVLKIPRHLAALVHVMACYLFSTNLLSEPVCTIVNCTQTIYFNEIYIKIFFCLWTIVCETISTILPYINSLVPGKFELNFRYEIFKQILVTGSWGISCEIALIWMSLDFTDDQSTLVQVMAWYHQATSHYLSQCWPKSVTIWHH